MPRRIDITGRRYGKLTAICPTDQKNAQGSVFWQCRCDCGNETEASVMELTSGNRKSCGCLKEESKRNLHDRLHLVDGTCMEWLEGRKGRTDNTSGFRGVHKKKNGKYSVSIGFKKKIYYVGVFERYREAVDARLRAERLIHDGFLAAHRMWKSMADRDPEWEEKNPFSFDVTKEDGRLVIRSSMDEFMHKETECASGSDGSITVSFLNLKVTSDPVPANRAYGQLQGAERERELMTT